MPMLQGKYRVPHFDAKAEANAHFAGLPTTFFMVSFYWDNLYLFALAPKKDDDGVYSWAFPMGDAKLAGIAKDDIGKAAYGVFKAGHAVHRQDGRRSPANMCPFKDMSEKLAKGTGYRPGAVQRRSTRTCSAASDSRAPTNTGNMFQVYRDFEKEVNAVRSVEETRKLTGGSLQTFDQWLAKNKDAVSRRADAASPSIGIWSSGRLVNDHQSR